MESLNGKWKGKFSFDNAESDYENMEHHFEMTIDVKDDDITGEIIDIAENDHSPVVATVGGFVDGEEISFIKQYPSLCIKNELNETIIDKTKPHPEIHYHGLIKEELINGTWEMEAGAILSAGQYYSQLVSGKWEMKKEDK